MPLTFEKPSPAIRWGRSVWGSEFDPSQPTHWFQRLADHNYDFVEVGCPPTSDEAARWRAAADTAGIDIVAQIQSVGSTPAEHALSLEDQISRVIALRPVLINSHSGRDIFSTGENAEICLRANAAASTGHLPIVHETHRSRATFSAPSTVALLERIPDLRLCGDFSHWCCVHESFLEDQSAAIQLALERCDYLHLRVGHTQGPQVTDPRSAENQAALVHHLAWWKQKWASLNPGSTFLVTPEFGPPPYMTLDPSSGQPLVDLWDLNEAMRAIVSQNFGC